MMAPTEIKRTKSQETGLNRIRNFFEIKRPEKSRTNSSTLPRTSNSNEDETENISGDRMFIRHSSHRASSRKKKFNKVTKPSVNHNELENKNTTVEDMCRLFESINSAPEENVIELKESISATSILDQSNDREKLLEAIAEREARIEELRSIEQTEDRTQRYIQKRVAKILTELTQLYQQTEVKRRNRYESEEKELRKRKIASFVEAETEEDAEEYRRSLIHEMDQEIAKMKADGFMDEDENTNIESQSEDIDGDINRSQQYDMPSSGENTFLDVMRYNSKHLLDESYRNSDDSQYTIQNDISEEKSSAFSFSFDDEFSESLGDEIEDGVTIVEAYNDEGRELIEIKLIIDRRTITVGSHEDIEVDIGESEMVFYHEDNNYKLLRDTVEDFSNKNGFLEEANQKSPEGSDLMSPTDDVPAEDVSFYSPLWSNRSTVYSSTSRDSSVFDEDDEGIEVGRQNVEMVYSNVRRETFCDDKGVIRIERVACPENCFPSDKTFTGFGGSSALSRSNSTTPARQLDYIIDEIKTTERKYVEDLGKIVKDYKPYIENNTPPHLIGRTGYLFGNIEKIYKKQMKFLGALEKCGDYVNVVRCFIDHKSVFELYQYYCKNKPKADSLIKDFQMTIKEMQDKFEERLDFSAYLLTPVQRLGKYILFLENIEKQLSKLNQSTESAQEALNIVRNEMAKGNDAVAVESIENSPISKLDYGPFKMREKFSISKPRKVEAMVFLFENVLVFTTNDQRNLEIFNYYDSIKMNDLRIATFEDYTIHLTDYTKSKKKNNLAKYTYVLEAKNEKLWNTWKENIENVLWKQLLDVKESLKVTAPRRYRKNKFDRNRIKSTGSSVFYVE